MRQRFILSICVALLLVPGSARGDEQEAPARRLIALEAELQRLLREVRQLRAALPTDEANIGAELNAAYEAEIGEPMPAQMLTKATEEVIALRSRLVAQIVSRYVAEGKKQPLQAPLASPLVVLQVRSGAGGGNPNRIDMRGGMSIYVDARVREEIRWSPTISSREDSRAFVIGGVIPEDKAFEITKVSWGGFAPGDGNGHGEIVVRAGDQTLVQRRDDGTVTEGVWEGRIVVRLGQEDTVNVEVANSSHIDARFKGRFINLADAPER